jgi:hypothetical protein
MDVMEQIAVYFITALGVSTYFYTTAILILGAFFFLFLIWRMCGNYVITRFKCQFLPGNRKAVLDGNQDGSAEFKAMKEKAGFLTSKYEQIKVGLKSVIRTKDGDLYVANSRYGLTWSMDVAAAASALNNLGYANLADALKKYDDEWFNKEENKEAYNKMLLEGEQKNIQGYAQIAIDEIHKQGQEVLMKLQWITPFTIPLSMLFNYGLAEIDSQVNKTITDREVYEAKMELLNERTKGFNAQTMMLIIMGIVIVMIAGALAMQMLPKQAAQAAVTVVTTTLP